MASVGATRIASRAGPSAESSATAAPVAMPIHASLQVSATGVGRLVVYSAFTVTEISPTVPPASRRPSPIPSDRSGQPEHQRLRQEQPEHRAAGGPDRPQDPDLRAPPHHAHRDRVVDQERAHHQGNVAQHSQVPAEGAQHPLVLVAARAGFAKQVRRRQHRADGLFYFCEILVRPDGHVDAVELAVAAEGLLRFGDVQQQEFGGLPVDGAHDGERLRAAGEVDGDLRGVRAAWRGRSISGCRPLPHGRGSVRMRRPPAGPRRRAARRRCRGSRLALRLRAPSAHRTACRPAGPSTLRRCLRWP